MVMYQLRKRIEADGASLLSGRLTSLNRLMKNLLGTK
jgi:hypothetical protein